ncbi:Arylsulfatase regulator (Fe-S oxidoreductase) [Collimonas arenae]|uniref:Arylsulfatase regulator (Fe-S oxidoreductase) n=1 Tax=Collimonas arenae TaxID=279058 RepID=A0A0A1FK64_9BURK|nr:radical SAM protein [Collimonas arenae]AIY44069.1 Arylsulfatase regulator (Fe-S oxidoreductase) [Collimonas arenae]
MKHDQLALHAAEPIPAPLVDAALAAGMAPALAARIVEASRPRQRDAHLIDDAQGAQLLMVNGSRLFHLPPELVAEFRMALDAQDDSLVQGLIASSGLQMAPLIDDVPLAAPPVHALSLAIAQKCNLGCTYCYAQQGEFGGKAKNMELETAQQAVDLLLRKAAPGAKVNLAFMGGEPLANRPALRAVTSYAQEQARQRGVNCHFSITTNGTLLQADDADFFEEHGFAVTVSLDGPSEQHNRLRPFKGGKGSFDKIIERLAPLLERQRQMQVSARVTVTPFNLNLPQTLDLFIGMGFHSVGFSPLLRASNGQAEMGPEDMEEMLQGMIACGLAFEQNVMLGRRYPFMNMQNALREIQRGTHRPYPCGAGAGYFGVSAEGELSACHRFVGDEAGKMGNLAEGVDQARQTVWLEQRHVHQQQPCNACWARYLCGGGCHHEVLARGRSACDYIRGWLHYTIGAHGRLGQLAPAWFADPGNADGD